MVYENIVYDSICGFATKKLRFNTIELIFNHLVYCLELPYVYFDTECDFM